MSAARRSVESCRWSGGIPRIRRRSCFSSRRALWAPRLWELGDENENENENDDGDGDGDGVFEGSFEVGLEVVGFVAVAVVVVVVVVVASAPMRLELSTAHAPTHPTQPAL